MADSRRPSPLTKLLGAVFFLSAHVLASAAVLGIDLGTEYIKAALVKPGIPLDIVLAKDSRRKETSAVAFKPLAAGPEDGLYPERSYGTDAMAIAARFPGDVFPNLKPLLGLPVEHAVVQEYAARHPALHLQPLEKGATAAFKSNTFPPEEDAWMVEELLAMELQVVQKNAEAAGGDGTSIRSVVLTVPPYYTTEEKRAIRTAAELAGLKILGLISDGLAIGLNYATARQFPNVNEGGKPEYHMVFDMGAGSTRATVMRFQSRNVKDVGKFNKTVQEIQVLGAGWDRTLGGDSLNQLIVDDMVSRFLESKGAEQISATAEVVKSNGRAMAKLAKEAERLRHVLSANQNTQASFEGLYEDVDFKYKITRAEFETMAEAHAGRVSNVIKAALEMSGIDMANIDSVIPHGGASRTPFVQREFEQAVGSPEKVRPNVNADEAAVFGAGFRAADLGPSFRVKEIKISEGPMYQAGLKWTKSNDKTQRQRLWGAASPMGGPAKELTFTEQTDFPITFYQQVGSEDRETLVMTTKNLTATVAAMKEQHPSCAGPTDVAFKLAVKLSSENGEVQIVRAAVECEAEASEKEGFVDGVKNLLGFGKKDQKPLKNVDEDSESEFQSPQGSENVLKGDSKSSDSSPSTGAAESSAPGDKEKKTSQPSQESKPEVKKKREIVSIPVDFVLELAGLPSLSKAEMTKAKDRLKAFAASDKARAQRTEALNQLEGYTYKIRDLLEGESFILRSTEEERTKLAEKASEIGDWLNEGGAEATKNELKTKLSTLHDLVAPIQTRIDEDVKRPELVSSLKKVLDRTSYFIEGLRQQISEQEKKQASESTNSSTESSTAASTPSESPTGEFDGLEDSDDDIKADAKAETAQKKAASKPPPYTREDLDVISALYKSTVEWLEDLEARQEALSPTADPVLFSKDILEKLQKLDKTGMDIAAKGMRRHESKAKKASKSTGGKKREKAKSTDGPEKPIKFSDGNGRLSPEELEQMIENAKKAAAGKSKDKDTDDATDKDKDEATAKNKDADKKKDKDTDDATDKAKDEATEKNKDADKKKDKDTDDATDKDKDEATEKNKDADKKKDKDTDDATDKDKDEATEKNKDTDNATDKDKKKATAKNKDSKEGKDKATNKNKSNDKAKDPKAKDKKMARDKKEEKAETEETFEDKEAEEEKDEDREQTGDADQQEHDEL